MGKNSTVVVGISNSHAHLAREHIDALFGSGYQLTFLRTMRQPDEFVSCETVDVVGPKGMLRRVRVIGPARQVTQIEISFGDAEKIGVQAELRLSHNVEKTPGAFLRGPSGECRLEEGIIVAARHLHATPEEAAERGLVDGQRVSVKTAGLRSITFHNVVVRVDPLFSLEFHVDKDEGNAAGLKNGDVAEWLLE